MEEQKWHLHKHIELLSTYWCRGRWIQDYCKYGYSTPQSQDIIPGIICSYQTHEFQEQWVIPSIFHNCSKSKKIFCKALQSLIIFSGTLKFLKFQDESDFHCGFVLLPCLTIFDILTCILGISCEEKKLWWFTLHSKIGVEWNVDKIHFNGS
jgi:hypothetical protein